MKNNHSIVYKYYYKLPKPIILISLLLFFVGYFFYQNRFVGIKEIHNLKWEFTSMKLGDIIRDAFNEEKPLIAVTAAGAIPYSTMFPCLDMLGLNDYFLPRNPPKDFGKGILGHELGDENYVLDNNPDIIIFDVGGPPAFDFGKRMRDMDRFKNDYVEVVLSNKCFNEELLNYINNPDNIYLYTNKYSKNIGIKKNSDSTIVIPGYLFSNRKNKILIDNKKKFYTSLNDSVSFTLEMSKLNVDNTKKIKIQKINNKLINKELEIYIERKNDMVIFKINPILKPFILIV